MRMREVWQFQLGAAELLMIRLARYPMGWNPWDDDNHGAVGTKPNGNNLSPHTMRWASEQDWEGILEANRDRTVTGNLPTPTTTSIEKTRARRWYHRHIEKHGTDFNLIEVLSQNLGSAERWASRICGVDLNGAPWEVAADLMQLPPEVRAALRGLPSDAKRMAVIGNGVNPVHESSALKELLSWLDSEPQA